MIRTSIVAFEINPPPSIDDTLRRTSVISEIADLVQDPKTPLAEVLRLITVEITYLVAAMRTCAERRAPFSQIKSNMGQIKALQLLSGIVIKNGERSGLDELNMDGSKFQSVYLEIEECFKEALEKATRRTPENDLLIQTTMRILRDIIDKRGRDIRRKLAKINS